jgi:hypothetical protein
MSRNISQFPKRTTQILYKETSHTEFSKIHVIILQQYRSD